MKHWGKTSRRLNNSGVIFPGRVVRSLLFGRKSAILTQTCEGVREFGHSLGLLKKLSKLIWQGNWLSNICSFEK